MPKFPERVLRTASLSLNWRAFLPAAAAVMGAALAVLPMSSAANAQVYPAKPVTLIVPFPPGGSTDLAGRFLAEKMSIALKQPIIVENRAGAAGAIGIRAVSAAQPDGYTLGVSGVGTSALLEAFGRDTGYSSERDLVYVAHMGSSALVLATRKDLAVQSLTELIELAKSKPDSLNYGTSGTGSPGHLAMESLMSKAGIKMRHVPYKGNTPLVTDLIGKHVDIGMLTIPGTAAQVKAGNLKSLAVTGAQRSSDLPAVPAVQELGFKGYSAELWNVLVAPKGTPQPIIDALNVALNAAMQDADLQTKFMANGLVPATMSAAQTKAFVDTERTKWTDVVKTSGVTAE